jgi:hypothetical protein
VISGDDPMEAIVELVAGYWARTDEGLIVSCLKGMFGAASMAGNLLAIHSESIAGASVATRLNGATFVDACAKMGDRFLTANEREFSRRRTRTRTRRNQTAKRR